MKKIIAKLINAIKNRRIHKEATIKIEIGESYHVKHTMRNDFYIKVTIVNNVWVWGFVMDAKTMNPGEEIILMRRLCIFTKLKGKA